MVEGSVENGRLVISLPKVIDSANAARVESQIQELRGSHPGMPVELDCDHLDYSTSAGLRVILRLKDEEDDTVLVNVHPDLYNILDMTGMTDILEVRRAYRVVSVEGCELIAQGSNGKIYRVSPDTIIKVYLHPDALPEILRVRELARLVFVAGIPTAIPYDVVRIKGGGYGAVFELLDARSFASLLTSGEKSLDQVAGMSVSLLRLIHSKKVDSPILPDIKKLALSRAEFLRDYLPPEHGEKLCSLIGAVPEDRHLLHGDFHLKNMLYQNGEALLIDMDKLCFGHPIFELANMYSAYVGFGLVDPGEITAFMGLPAETCGKLWRRSLELYLNTRDETRIAEVEEKAKVIALMRQMRREIRLGGLERESDRQMIETCRELLSDLLPGIDTLLINE